jgi:hypothetical protein
MYLYIIHAEDAIADFPVRINKTTSYYSISGRRTVKAVPLRKLQLGEEHVHLCT